MFHCVKWQQEVWSVGTSLSFEEERKCDASKSVLFWELFQENLRVLLKFSCFSVANQILPLIYSEKCLSRLLATVTSLDLLQVSFKGTANAICSHDNMASRTYVSPVRAQAQVPKRGKQGSSEFQVRSQIISKFMVKGHIQSQIGSCYTDQDKLQWWQQSAGQHAYYRDCGQTQLCLSWMQAHLQCIWGSDKSCRHILKWSPRDMGRMHGWRPQLRQVKANKIC